MSDLLPKTIEADVEQAWLTIWLNRPEVSNALNEQMTTELRNALEAVRDDRTVRGITLRGRGGICFSDYENPTALHKFRVKSNLFPPTVRVARRPAAPADTPLRSNSRSRAPRSRAV